MAVILNTLVRARNSSDYLLVAVLLVVVITAVKPLIMRLSPPRGAPVLIKASGKRDAPSFSSDRAEYLKLGKKQSRDGQFSFWHGPHHVVAISGHSARDTYLTTRGLDSVAGFLALLGNFLNVDGLTSSYNRHIMLVYKRCTQDEHMSQTLPHLITDSDIRFKQMEKSGIVNPVDAMGGLIYQLTHRAVGSYDIADNLKLVDETRANYMHLEESSVFDLWFPMFPTPGKWKRFWGYTKLYWSVQSSIKNRRQTGRVESDAMQLMMDQGVSDPLICLGIIGAILAGVFNTSITAAWNLCFLAQDQRWRAQLRTEIDAVIERHRFSQSESPTDTLRHLTLQDWEKEFPRLELVLKETLRFVMSGTIVRKNISGKDIALAGTESVIPKNSVAVYPSADVHMDGEIYKEPLKWDPSRHDKHRAEGTQTPHSFLGWGSGNHPCPAMRFAKLNVVVPTVMFLASYEFEMCDHAGTKVSTPLPGLNFDRVGAGRPSGDVHMTCRLRAQKQ